jgi:integrase
MKDLSVDLLENFKSEGLPDFADTSRATAIAKLRCFLKDAFRRGWIKAALVDLVTGHKAIHAQKDPYSDADVAKILDGALGLKGGTHGYARRPRTFRLLLEVILETGMRVGDAVRFDPSQLQRGDHL